MKVTDILAKTRANFWRRRHGIYRLHRHTRGNGMSPSASNWKYSAATRQMGNRLSKWPQCMDRSVATVAGWTAFGVAGDPLRRRSSSLVQSGSRKQGFFGRAKKAKCEGCLSHRAAWLGILTACAADHLNSLLHQPRRVLEYARLPGTWCAQTALAGRRRDSYPR